VATTTEKLVVDEGHRVSKNWSVALTLFVFRPLHTYIPRTTYKKKRIKKHTPTVFLTVVSNKITTTTIIMIAKFFGLLARRIIPFLALLLAIAMGVIYKTDNPLATFFSIIYTVPHGYLPPAIFGAFSPCPVPPVPDDMAPVPLSEHATYLTLPHTGDGLPQIGLGTCCRATAYDPESIRRSVLWYLLLGGRHVDTADLYGNHQPIGEAIQEAMKRGIPRKEIFVTTKIPPSDFGYFSVLDRITKFLHELQLDYIDLVLLHAASGTMGGYQVFRNECSSLQLSHPECRATSWNALATAQKNGWVRNIGVSNFNQRQLKELQALKRATIAVNQISFNPWSPSHWQESYQYCSQQGIAVVAWSSLAGSSMQTMTALTQETLREIASTHHRPVAQILLRWSLQKGVAIIPGTGNPHHMTENLQVYEFELTLDEMKRIDTLSKDPSAETLFSPPEDDT
jgi:diketogulonate reductase-like aldo/keto reductase